MIYRIRQNIQGGKLSRFGQQMVIRGKTFAVQDTFVIKRLNVKGRKSVTRVERAMYSLDTRSCCNESCIQVLSTFDFPPRLFCRIRYFR